MNMLTDTETKAVQDIVIEQLGVTRDQVTPEAMLKHDLGADSLDEVEISMALEDRFSLSIPDEKLEQVKTIGDVYELIANSLGRPGIKV
jgi:acyl carrier protein